MRDWNPPAEDYADILVSELLGSFGDNELRCYLIKNVKDIVVFLAFIL